MMLVEPLVEAAIAPIEPLLSFPPLCRLPVTKTLVMGPELDHDPINPTTFKLIFEPLLAPVKSTLVKPILLMNCDGLIHANPMNATALSLALIYKPSITLLLPSKLPEKSDTKVPPLNVEVSPIGL